MKNEGKYLIFMALSALRKIAFISAQYCLVIFVKFLENLCIKQQ
jgi:hypothetical protein